MHWRIDRNTVNCLLTPWSRVLLEKLAGFQLVKKFPAYYGIRRFITEYIRPRHLSPTWARSIESMPPHPTFCRSILILSSYLRLGLPSGSLPRVSPPKPCIRLSSPHTYYMPRPSHSRFYHPNHIGWGVQNINPLKPNDAYRRRTAPLTSKVAFYIFIQQI